MATAPVSTTAGDKATALRAWTRLVEGRTEFDGVPVEGNPAVSRTEK